MRPYSQMQPDTKIAQLCNFNKRIRESERSLEILKEWGLKLEENLVRLSGRRINAQELYINDKLTKM